MNVLIAIDEDSCKNAIVQFVTDREWPNETKFLVMHVIDSQSTPSDEKLFIDDRKAANRFVRKIALALRDKFHTPYVEARVVAGTSKEKIEEIAREWHADLVVVGSQGNFREYLFGSVAESVINKSDCSVLVVKPHSPTNSSRESTTTGVK